MFLCKKKGAPKETVIANLDYDKLAEAIVKAQRKASEQEIEKDNTVFFSKTILQTAFFSIGAMLLIFFGYGVYMLFTSAQSALQIGLQIVLCIMVLIYAVGSFGMIRSIGRIKDRNYLFGFFSALVALTALIVTIVKG